MLDNISTTRKETSKIGINKGKSRLWIEGALLTSAGFRHGQRYNIQHHSRGFTIISDEINGKRKISGKADRPVIDITASGLGALHNMPKGTMVTLEYKPSAQVIFVSAESQVNFNGDAV